MRTIWQRTVDLGASNYVEPERVARHVKSPETKEFHSRRRNGDSNSMVLDGSSENEVAPLKKVLTSTARS